MAQGLREGSLAGAGPGSSPELHSSTGREVFYLYSQKQHRMQLQTQSTPSVPFHDELQERREMKGKVPALGLSHAKLAEGTNMAQVINLCQEGWEAPQRVTKHLLGQPAPTKSTFHSLEFQTPVGIPIPVIWDTDTATFTPPFFNFYFYLVMVTLLQLLGALQSSKHPMRKGNDLF